MIFPEPGARSGGFELPRGTEARQPFLAEGGDLLLRDLFVNVGVRAERVINNPTGQTDSFGADGRDQMFGAVTSAEFGDDAEQRKRAGVEAAEISGGAAEISGEAVEISGEAAEIGGGVNQFGLARAG